MPTAAVLYAKGNDAGKEGIIAVSNTLEAGACSQLLVYMRKAAMQVKKL